MNISSINCKNQEELDTFDLNDLKKKCREYGLNDHGTKITLCQRIQSYLQNITASNDNYLDVNNIKKINTIYDLVSVLKLEDLSQIHDLDMFEVEFLFNEISKEYPQIIDEMTTLIKKYPPIDQERGDIDTKMLLITDYLGKIMCDCIKKNKKEFRKRAPDVCKRSIFRNRNLKISQYKCSKNKATILPKFGQNIVINYDD
jgi:hypothetical protein